MAKTADRISVDVPRIALEICGIALRDAGISRLEQLEFCMFPDGGGEMVQGGERRAVQDKYLDFRERLERIPPGVLRTIQAVRRYLPEDGYNVALCYLGYLSPKKIKQRVGESGSRQLAEMFEKRLKG